MKRIPGQSALERYFYLTSSLRNILREDKEVARIIDEPEYTLATIAQLAELAGNRGCPGIAAELNEIYQLLTEERT